MRRPRFAILTVLVAAATVFVAAAPAPAGLGYSWVVTPTTVSCFTSGDGSTTGVSFNGPVTADLPASPPATLAVSQSINGGGSTSVTVNQPTHGVGIGTSLPSTTTVVLTLTVDGSIASVQTLELFCLSPAPAPGESYAGTFGSGTVINPIAPPSNVPTDTPVADAVSAAPRVAG